MTRTQIARTLNQAGVDLQHMTISRGEVEVWTGNETSSQRLARKAMKALGWGGYRTGYGAWVLQAKSTDKGDWNDKSSRWHY